MDKRRVHFETSCIRRERGGRSFQHLPYKVKYKNSIVPRAGKGSYTQRFLQDLQRREHKVQINEPDIAQQRLHTNMGKGSYTQRFLQDLPRREHKVQINEPDIAQQRLHTTMEQEGSNFRIALLKMTIMDLLPVNLIEEEGFQHFMNALHPYTDISLSASWIQAELLNMYEHTRLKVQREISKAKELVLSAEMWIISKEASYLTVTSHFIDEKWELKSHVLETAHLLGEHTPENVHQQLWRISTEWKIMEKIQVVVVNVDGMKKANPKPLWTYVPCFSHTLNKVLREAMDNPDWRDLLKKCHRIVARFQQSGPTVRNIQLIQSPGIEWLPMLTMLEKISEQWPCISEEFLKKQEENLWLNEKEREMLNSAVVALTAIKDVTGEMGKSGYSSVSNIIPLRDKLQQSLDSLKQSGNKVALRLAEKCHHHTGNIKQNVWFTDSTALDPRFKSSVLQKCEAEKIKARIKDEIHRQASGATSNGFNRENAREMSYKDLALQSYWKERDRPEIQNPLKFWASKEGFKELATVARKYLTVVSTAIPVERVTQHDKSQLIFNRRRCIEPQNVNVMLFLRSNQK